MKNIKKERLESYMVRELSSILRDSVKDPALKMCTITGIQLSNDLSHAKIFVSFMEHKKRGFEALERSKGFIRKELASKLKIRKCPELHFTDDTSLDYGNHIESLLRNLNKKD